jgi:hypothetical protein
MARLTILQASQQGFGSTLTIHRHIKEGSLPIYEEGDTKLLEVDDLIALLGEPGKLMNVDETVAEPSEIDIYEYNRMKSELDQKNKKNMWLAADLAEVVRELKDKESKFEAERDRLLKVLEQAQALLLREAKRAGGALKKADISALKIDQVAAGDDATDPAEPQAPAIPENKAPDLSVGQAASDTHGDETALMPNMSPEGLLPPKDAESAPETEGPDAGITPESALSGMSPEPLAGTLDAPSTPTVDGPRSRIGINPINPLTPPLQETADKPRKSRLIGTMLLLMLASVAGVGFVFFEFRTQFMSSIDQIMKTLAGT